MDDEIMHLLQEDKAEKSDFSGLVTLKNRLMTLKDR